MWRKPKLHGAPAIRRIKNYSADSGYVYQYWYCGMRESAGTAEYVFAVSAGQTPQREITLSLKQDVVVEWTEANRRDLNAPEQYGIVKAALFRLFDEAETPANLAATSRLEPADLDKAAAFLGLL